MKKVIITIILFVIISPVLIGCTTSKNEFDIGDKSDIKVVESGVNLSIKENTLTNTGVTLILKNNTETNIEYGNPYSIEIKDKKEWHKINVEINFTLPAYILKPNESKEIELNWKNTYGELALGEYRIIKNISVLKEDETYEIFNVSTEFTIK